jgi:hypothetical protein
MMEAPGARVNQEASTAKTSHDDETPPSMSTTARGMAELFHGTPKPLAFLSGPVMCSIIQR